MANMQNTLKGIMYIIGGIILLLHTLDIMKESLQYVLIAGSIIMILYGLLKSGLIEKITHILQSNNLTKKTDHSSE